MLLVCSVVINDLFQSLSSWHSWGFFHSRVMILVRVLSWINSLQNFPKINKSYSFILSCVPCCDHFRLIWHSLLGGKVESNFEILTWYTWKAIAYFECWLLCHLQGSGFSPRKIHCSEVIVEFKSHAECCLIFLEIKRHSVKIRVPYCWYVDTQVYICTVLWNYHGAILLSLVLILYMVL